MDLREIPGHAFTRHPWESARVRFFTALLRGHRLLESPLEILDAGSGDGYFASQLALALPAESRVTCLDVNYSDAFLAGATVEQGQVLEFTRNPPSRTFDLLLLLDVLEHVPDDLAFLKDLVECNVRAGGHVLMSVPAFRGLFTQHDLRLGHYRRYTGQQLAAVAAATGLHEVVQGGLFHSLLIPRALQKLEELLRGMNSIPDPESPRPGDTGLSSAASRPGITRLLAGALRLDTTVSSLAAGAGVYLPGLSTWMLARK